MPTRTLIAGIVLVGLAGCSSDTNDSGLRSSLVRGVVTLNGRPLQRGTVTFIPQEVASGERVDPGIARIEPDGTYWLGNANLSKPAGVRPGRYKVTILAMAPRPDGPEGPIARLEIPEDYTEETTTPFEVEVAKGQNRIRLDLVTDMSAEKPGTSTSR